MILRSNSGIFSRLGFSRKKSLNISKRQSESINRSTDKTMIEKKDKRTNNDIQRLCRKFRIDRHEIRCELMRCSWRVSSSCSSSVTNWWLLYDIATWLTSNMTLSELIIITYYDQLKWIHGFTKYVTRYITDTWTSFLTYSLYWLHICILCYISCFFWPVINKCTTLNYVFWTWIHISII